ADAGFFTGAATNGALDVVLRHVHRFRLGDDRPQPRIRARIAPARASRDRQLLDDPRKDLAALGIERALLVLDRMPLGMAGHGETPERASEVAPENGGKITQNSNTTPPPLAQPSARVPRPTDTTYLLGQTGPHGQRTGGLIVHSLPTRHVVPAGLHVDT